MVIRGKVFECDVMGIKYPDGVDGGWCVVEGASGRFCVVMHIGPEYLAKYKSCDITTYENAVALVIAKNGIEYVDF